MSGSARGLIVAAPASGQGKTTITLGLLRALADAGTRVAPAKAGPDYIDPGFHARAARRVSLNLDPWAMRESSRDALVARLAADADLVICEGVMGLFDGTDARGSHSTGALAAALGWPVVLVVDAHGLAASIVPLVAGFANHRRDVRVAGVILNRVGSARHAELLVTALAEGLPALEVLGAVPTSAEIVLPSRHLGLVPADELEGIEAKIAATARLVARSLALARLHDLATPIAAAPLAGPMLLPPLGQRIAVARDAAFAFAYPAQLDAWRLAGATLSFFSPLADAPPDPDSDAVFLPGGYPELHAGRLAAASRFKTGLHEAAARGAAIYGECGGYMVLGRGLLDADGARHAMAELLLVETSFATRRLHLGYREVSPGDDLPFAARGQWLRGHEFHYASTLSEGGGEPLFTARDAAGRALGRVGQRIGRVAGSFIHLVDRGEAPRLSTL